MRPAASLTVGAVVLALLAVVGTHKASACVVATGAVEDPFGDDARPVVAVAEYKIVKVWPESEVVTRGSFRVPVRLWGVFEATPQPSFLGGEFKGVPPTTSSCGPAQGGPHLGTVSYGAWFEGGGHVSVNARWIDFDRLDALFGEPVVANSVELPDEFPYQGLPADLASGGDGFEPPIRWGWIVVTAAAGTIVLAWFGWRRVRNRRSPRPTRVEP